MIDTKRYADCFVAMASIEGARDNGTRLEKVIGLIAQIKKDAGPDRQKESTALDDVLTRVKTDLKGRAGAAEYLADVTDLFTTQKRHLADGVA